MKFVHLTGTPSAFEYAFLFMSSRFGDGHSKKYATLTSLAAELATRIAKKTPEGINRIFYTICGSTAVETAIKIAIAYHRAKGDSKRFRFVGRERGYHGMNIGATTVGGMINNVKTFASVLMPGVQHMRHTHLPVHKFVKGQP